MASESLLNHLQEWETESPPPSLSAEPGGDLMRDISSSETAGEDLQQRCQREQPGVDGTICGVQNRAQVEVARSWSLEIDCLRR